jgi:5-methylcytosine-specific restriction protein A
MTYPSYDELELPLLKLLYEQGGEKYEMKAIATYRPLAKHFTLSEIELTQSRDDVLGDGRDEPFWNNMVQWAKRKLKERGYLDPASRGIWRLSQVGVKKAVPLSTGTLMHVSYPDEVGESTKEGATKTVSINYYERSSKARQACIDHYGYLCFVCSFNFEKIYGERGKHFIHVHHIIPLASIGVSYTVDPIKDLRPVCPNCHAIIHRTDPPCSVDELRQIKNEI